MTVIQNIKPTHMLPRDMQETNERRFSKRHINDYIVTAIQQDPEIMEQLEIGVENVMAWLAYWLAPLDKQTTSQQYYDTKFARLSQVNEMDLEELVLSIFVGIAYVQQPQLLVAVTAQLAAHIGFDDKRDSILTMAELVAIVSTSDAYSIRRATEDSSVMVHPHLSLPTELIDTIARAQYLPPMVCAPDDVTHNWDDPHLTFNDSLMLGRGNGHEGDYCLDVINTQNSIPLKLDIEFLSVLEEAPSPSKPLDSEDKKYNWEVLKYHSYHMYSLMQKQGNKFYITNKVDTRLRLYSQGYHINSQGSPHKKAMIEFYHEEIVTGAPT